MPLLLDQGHRVILFEAFARPGGYTAGFRRQGYYFESGTPSFESIGVFEKMMSDLGLAGRLPLGLLDDPSIVPETTLRRIREAAVSEGIFTVYLGLRMSGAELQSKLEAHSVAVMPLDRDVDPEDAKAADHFEKDGFSLYSPSLVNPALAPRGRSSLMIQAISPAHW